MTKEQNPKSNIKRRRPMSEIANDIREIRKKKPTQQELNNLFDILKDEGLAQPLDKVAKSRDPETSV